MSFSTVIIVSLAAAIVLVVGGGLMMYMANLVRNAYELKVQLGNDLDERLAKISDDMDKKSRWIKRDLIEEIDKIKTGIQTDNARRFDEFSDALGARLAEIEQVLAAGRAEWVKAIDADREGLKTLDARIRTVRQELKDLERRAGLSSPAAGAAATPLDAALDQAAAVLAAVVAPAPTPAPAPAADAPAPPAEA